MMLHGLNKLICMRFYTTSSTQVQKENWILLRKIEVNFWWKFFTAKNFERDFFRMKILSKIIKKEKDLKKEINTKSIGYFAIQYPSSVKKCVGVQVANLNSGIACWISRPCSRLRCLLRRWESRHTFLAGYTQISVSTRNIASVIDLGIPRGLFSVFFSRYLRDFIIFVRFKAHACTRRQSIDVNLFDNWQHYTSMCIWCTTKRE